MNNAEIIAGSLIVIVGLQALILLIVLAAWYELRSARLRLKVESALYTLDTAYVRAKRAMVRVGHRVYENIQN